MDVKRTIQEEGVKRSAKVATKSQITSQITAQSKSARSLMQLGAASSVGILTQAGLLQTEAEAVPAATLVNAIVTTGGFEQDAEEDWSWTTWICIGIVEAVVAMAVCWQQFWAVANASNNASVISQKNLETFCAAPGHAEFATSNGSAHIQGRKGRSPELSVTELLCEGLPLALPAVCIAFLELFNQAVGTYLLMGVGVPLQLAGLGIATMMTACVSVSFGTGLCSAMDTLVSQAHGAGYHILSCRYFQQCRMLLMAQLLWIAPLFWWSQEILILVGQQPEAAAEAASYCRVAILGVALYFQTCCALFFLKNRGEVMVSVMATFAGGLVYLITGLFCVQLLELGTYGVACAMLASNFTTFLVSHMYLVFFSEAEGLGYRTLLWVEGKAIADLVHACPTYLSLALPAVVTMSVDVLFWELNTMVVGLLGQVPLAAHVVAFRMHTFASLSVLGVGSAVATMVGTAVGAKQPEKAMKVAKYGLSVGLLAWALFAPAFAYSRVQLADMYTDWHEVQELVEPLCLFLAFAGFFNAAQGSVAGALRGIGLQLQVALIQIVCFYFMAMALGAVLAFGFDLGVHGIYTAFGVGAAFSLGTLHMVLHEVNFESTTEDADRRMQWEKLGMRPPTLANFDS